MLYEVITYKSVVVFADDKNIKIQLKGVTAGTYGVKVIVVE